MAVDGSLIFDTKIDTKGFKSGTNTIRSQANSLKSVFLSIGKTIGIAFGVRELIRFGQEAVSLASNLQEVQNVVDVAFGDMKYKMEQFANTAIETYGISELTAKKTGSSFMAMAKGIGLASGTASDMSIQLTALSADMASFYNVSQDEARTALSAVFTGETETLKRYGILITEVNLQEYARQQGISKSINAMTQQEKVMLRANYIMNATKLAQGDFARTSNSWANQTRVLSERWKEFLSIIGTGLIQVLTPVVKFLNTVLSNLISFANAAGKILSSLFGIKSAVSGTAGAVTDTASAVSDVSTNADSASGSLDNLGGSAKKAADEAKKSTAGFDELNILSENVADNADSASDALGGLGGNYGTSITPSVKEPDTKALEAGLAKVIKRIKDLLKPAFDAFDRLKIAVAPFAKNVGEGLKWFLSNVLIPLGAWTISKLVPVFLDLLGVSIKVLNAVIEVFKPYALWFWNNFLLPIAKWTGGLIISSLSSLVDALNGLAKWIMKNQELVAKAAFLIGSFFLAFKVVGFVAALAPVISTIATLISSGALLGSVLDVIAVAFGVITSPATIIAAVLGFLIYTFVDLYSSSEEFRKSIANLGATWSSALAPLATFVSTVLSDAWNKILKPIISFFIDTLIPNLITTFENLWTKILVPLANFIGTVLQPVFKILSSVLTILWQNVILPLAQVIGVVLKEAWNSIYQALNTTIIPIIGAVISVLQFLWTNAINPIINALWDKLEPAFSAVFRIIGTLIKSIGTILTGLMQFITGVFIGDWQKAWNGIKTFFSGILTAIKSIVALVGPYFLSKFGLAYNNVVLVFKGIGSWFGSRWKDITTALKDVAGWFNRNFKSAWDNVTAVFSLKSIGAHFGKVYGAIQGCFSGVATWFQTTFSTAWGEVKKVFSTGGKIYDGIKEGIGETFKSVVNKLIDGINAVIAVPFDTINSALNTIRNINIPVAGRVFAGLPTIQKVKIPPLATGTVVPANYGNFLAMLGDNKREPEVVSPLSTMKQAVKEAMKEFGGNNGNITIQCILDGKLVHESVVKHNNYNTRRTGKNALA